jgi:hypothetical protein
MYREGDNAHNMFTVPANLQLPTCKKRREACVSAAVLNYQHPD